MFDTLTILLDLDYAGLQTKLTAAVNGVFEAITKLNLQKVKWDDIINMQGFGSINWSELMTKLFSPANLVLMFSALAAVGITSALQQQQIALTTGGGTTLTPNQMTQGGQAALGVLENLGLGVSNLQQINSLLDTFFAQFSSGNAQTAESLTTNLAAAITRTGGSLSTFDVGGFESLLGALNATDPSQVNDITDALMNAAKNSEGLMNMSTAVQQLQGPITTMAAAGIPFTDLLKSIVLYGSMIGSGMGVSQAQDLFSSFAEALNNPISKIALLTGGTAHWQEIVKSKGPKEAIIEFADAIKNYATKDGAGLAGEILGVSQNTIAASKNMDTYKSKLKDTANVGKSAVSDINKQISQTQTAMESLTSAWDTFWAALGKSIQASPLLPALTTLINLITSLMDLASGQKIPSTVTKQLGSAFSLPSGDGIGNALLNIGGIGVGSLLGDIFGKKPQGSQAASSSSGNSSNINYSAITVNNPSPSSSAQQTASQIQHVQKMTQSSYQGINISPIGVPASTISFGGTNSGF